jgi:DNA-directed RNA polymerase beta' subunit
MPAGFQQPTSDVESVVGIQFGIFGPDEIVRRSVVEVISPSTYDGNEPKIGGLFDPRMGVLENGKSCRSCGQTNHGCPGHFGHYRLARPVYFIQFLPEIRNVLRCVCIRCGKLLIDKNTHPRILKRRGEARRKLVLEACSNVKRCGQETEDGCGTTTPTKFYIDGIARIVAEWEQKAADEAPGDSAAKKSVITQPLEVEYVLRLFRQITDEDVDFMGLSRYWCRPDWMICTVLPIPPPQVRPSVVQENNQRSEDDLTHKLFEIIKNNKKLQDLINKNSNRNMIHDMTVLLQYHVATLVDNKIPGVAPSAQRGGRPLKSLQQRIGSKEGRVRYNIQGKRVEQSARSVITGDPNISIAEVGVPMKIAMNLTRPEVVTNYNRDTLYKYVQNGADVFPGAKSVVRGKDGRMISLKHVNTKEIKLYNGDTVNRHLMDGDIILFNRQPTLHRMSMMGHRVRVLPYNTFRLNVTVTRPYNADFDGDEMNAHIPQSYEATAELQEIASVPMQIIRPRDSTPVIGVVQDALAGSYLATRPGNYFTRREFMNMMMKNKRFSTIPEPVMQDNFPRYTGQQMIETLLAPINLNMANSMYDSSKADSDMVKIVEGKFLQGTLDKGVFNKSGKGIVHVTYNDYGPKEAVDLMDGLQSMMESYLIMKGFSVGISDLIADEDTRKKMEETIQIKKKEIDDLTLQLHMGLFTNNSGKSNQEEFEAKCIGILGKATDDAGKVGVNSLSGENRLMAMVRSGSKGDKTNVAQMIACLGQVSIEGRRIPYGFTDRTLPHYKMFDDGAEARGFVESSFMRGLTPQEFFFHAMAGREGLIDTAVKSVTGDTKIVVMENGVTKCVAIGDWIDAHLATTPGAEFFPEDNNLEILQLSHDSTFIPTVSVDGKVTWGKVSAVTRHDPGQKLYEVTTLGGRSVIVPESKSLLVWRPDTKTFEQMPTPDVRPGHCMPVTMQLAAPPTICTAILLENYLPKATYLYGTDFEAAQKAVENAMMDRDHIPTGWWNQQNGTTFTLPYDSKARFVRTLARSKTDNILPGYVYPFTTNRDHARIPEHFVLDENNGRFLGLFLAEGNVDVKSGYVAITNNNPNITQFVHDWFETQRIRTSEDVKLNHIGGVTTTVRGYSTVLAKFLDVLVGHGAASKHVPAEAFAAHESFITALLDGYFSGDGTITKNSVEAGSASKELIDGVAMLCSRLGIFAKVFKSQLTSNNLGTEVILPTYRISIRAQWARRFAGRVRMIDDAKEAKLHALKESSEHRNFPFQNDVVLDEIVDIKAVSVDAYPKLYDLTVPATFTFGLANGLQVYDTADTGYTQRQLIKAMEDLMTQHDGTVRDSSGKIVQFRYGEDGINSTKLEQTSLPVKFADAGLKKIVTKSVESVSVNEIKRIFTMEGVDFTSILAPGTERGDDKEALDEFVSNVLKDRKMFMEGIFGSGQTSNVFSALNLDRILLNIRTKFDLKTTAMTNLSPMVVLDGINKLIERTQPYNKLWVASLRTHLAPHDIVVNQRFTMEAWTALTEIILVKNWKSWAIPGELVGIVAAQSIGEPATQMTLNTFHQAGVAAKSAMTRGVPRLKELLKVTKKPKATSLSVYLKNSFRENKDMVRQVAQDLELTLLKDIILKAAIYYDPNDETVSEDADVIKFFKETEMIEQVEEKEPYSKWVIRFEFDREKMFNKNITMDDVYFVIQNAYGFYGETDNNVQTIYTDFNSQKLVMRIRPKVGDSAFGDELASIKKFQSNLISNTIIRGVFGIKAVNWRKDNSRVEDVEGEYKKIDQYVLDTDGSNFVAVMNHPAVDGNRLYSTNVHDIYDQLGIEATRGALYSEISSLFGEAEINYRHLGLLCDIMTHAGRLMSIDRYGINKMDNGPLAKACFEETEKVLLRAALYGEMDPVTGVSANIMTGQPIRAGTAFTQILLDEDALPRLMEGLPAFQSGEEEEDGLQQDQIDTEIYGGYDDKCNKIQNQMNMTLGGPGPSIDDEEDDIELVEVK